MNNFERFVAVLKEELEKGVIARTDRYRWTLKELPQVAAAMEKALRAGTYQKDGDAIKGVCKRLGIKRTYKAINAYLNEGGGA